MKPLVRKARTRAIPAILLGIVLSLVVVPMAAGAAPTGTAVKVYKSPCKGGTCDSDDTPLSSGATVRGTIVITVASGSTVGLSSVDLEADGPSGSTVCLRRWDPNGAKSFSNDFTWVTTGWPTSGEADGCSSSGVYGDSTPNGSYTIRVTALDATGQATQTTSVSFDNPPQTPAWSGQPTASGEQTNQPVVTLRWTQNPEPDIRSYDVIRRDPSGNKRTVRVDASDPGAQGCSRSGGDYECLDSNFPSADWSGTYTYSLIAFRDGAAGGLLPSQESGGRSVSLTEPPPPPPSPTPEAGGSASTSPSASPESSPTQSATSPSASPLAQATVEALRTTRPDNSEFFTGTFEKSLPYSSPSAFAPQTLGVRPSQTVIAESAEGTPDDRSPLQVLVPVAGGLLALLGAGHILRVLTGR